MPGPLSNVNANVNANALPDPSWESTSPTMRGTSRSSASLGEVQARFLDGLMKRGSYVRADSLNLDEVLNQPAPDGIAEMAAKAAKAEKAEKALRRQGRVFPPGTLVIGSAPPAERRSEPQSEGKN
jgi:hypothetical protein